MTFLRLAALGYACGCMWMAYRVQGHRGARAPWIVQAVAALMVWVALAVTS